MNKELFIEPASMDIAWNDPWENLRRMEAILKKRLAKHPKIPSESRLFVFPELCLTGFVTKRPSSFGLKPMHPVLKQLASLAARHKTALVAGFPEQNPKNPAKPYNAAVLVNPQGDIIANYHKIHLFTQGDSAESKGYTPGKAGLVCRYRGWKIGFSICFDIRFPALFHAYAREKVDLLLMPSCWIGGVHKTYQFKTINSGHAILTQAYAVAVNRSGRDPFFEYDGSEYAFSPYGENRYEGSPVKLDAQELELCRKLIVRPSDQERYPVKPA